MPTEVPPKGPTINNYLDAIRKARDTGKSVSIEFKDLPFGIDAGSIRKELSNRLPSDYVQAINKSYVGSSGIRLDFSKITLEPTFLEKTKKVAKEAKEAVGEIGAPVTKAIEAAKAIPGKIVEPALAFQATKPGKILEDFFKDTATVERFLEETKANLLKSIETGEALRGRGKIYH